MLVLPILLLCLCSLSVGINPVPVFSSTFRRYHSATNFTVGWLSYNYQAKLMNITYTKYGYTEVYDYNANQLYAMGSFCGSCSSLALTSPMPVLLRDLSVYTDSPLTTLDGRPCWELPAPPQFATGPFPVRTIWISAVNQYLLQIQLTDGTKYKIYVAINEPVTINPPPSLSACPASPLVKGGACDNCCDFCICQTCSFPSYTSTCSPPLDPCVKFICDSDNGCYTSPMCPNNGCTTYSCQAGTCIPDTTSCRGNCTVNEDCDFCNNQMCTPTGCATSPTNLNYCDDGRACTTDTCVSKQCFHTRKSCNVPVTDQNKCVIYECLLGDCLPAPDPTCSTSTNPNCVYVWSQWSACSAQCPATVGTRSRTQTMQGTDCSGASNNSVTEHCLTSCGAQPPPSGVVAYPIEVCWEYLPDGDWASYLAYRNPTGNVENFALGTSNKITVDGTVVNVLGQPTIFYPGTSPFFVSVVRPKADSSVKIEWILGTKKVSFKAYKDATIPLCPPTASFLYEIIIPQKQPGFLDLKQAQTVIAENFKTLIPQDIYFRVKLSQNTSANSPGNTSTWLTLITLSGSNPMYHANSFVIDALTGNVDLSQSLVGVGATLGEDNGQLHMVVNELGISPTDVEQDLDGWQIALIVLGCIATVIILAVIFVTLTKGRGEDPSYSSV